MKKSELKSGMVLETRNGRRYVIYMDVDVAARTGGMGWMRISQWNEDLTSSGRDYDVVAAYRPKYEYRYGSTAPLHLTKVWTRESEIKITVEVNGERVPLSTLSDETIQKIKEQE